MENKLQELTERLYNQGLERGRTDGDALLDKARKEAEQIVKDAKDKAAQIADQARRDAQQLSENTANEIRLASSQMSSSLRQQIERMIVAEVITPQLSAAWQDGSFLKEVVLGAVSALDPAQGLQVILPEGQASELMANIKAAVAEKFGQGVEVTTDARVKVPFRIASKEGGYYISFADRDFDQLFKSYLRPRVAELLFGSGGSHGAGDATRDAQQ